MLWRGIIAGIEGSYTHSVEKRFVVVTWPVIIEGAAYNMYFIHFVFVVIAIFTNTAIHDSNSIRRERNKTSGAESGPNQIMKGLDFHELTKYVVNL